MANVARYNGFKFAFSKVGASQAQVRAFPADASRSTTNNGGNIYIGDAVTLTSGLVVPFVSTGTTAGGPALGVVVGVAENNVNGTNTAITTTMVPPGPFNPDNLNINGRFLAANRHGWVYVVMAEDNVFEVNNAHTSTALANVGALFSVIADPQTSVSAVAAATVSHGSTTTGVSTHAISTNVTTNSDVRVIGISTQQDNDPTAINSRVLVEFANPVLGAI